MSLGVFGGTFNPVHLAHLRLAEVLRETLQLERVLFVPAGVPPLKRGVAPAADRLEMVRRAIATHPDFEVTDLELRRPGPSFTVDTLRELRRAEPVRALWFALGSDALAELDQWRESEHLIELAHLAVFRRAGAPRAPALELLSPRLARGFRREGRGWRHACGHELVEVDFPPLEISASDIRARVAAGRSIRYLVPEEVREYLAKQRLYQEVS